MKNSAILACALLIPSLLLAEQAAPQTASAIAANPATGRIEGRVVAPGGAFVDYANVNIVGQSHGTLSDSLGRFVLRDVPAGRVVLRALSMLYAAVEQSVVVAQGATAHVTLVLGSERPATELEEFEVIAHRKVDRTRTESVLEIGRDKIQMTAVDGYMKVLETMAGVVAKGGQMFVRGSRPDEVQVRIADVDVTDPLHARSAETADVAVQSVQLHLGGLSAEYGGSLSGVVNVDTREGADSLAGELRWDTDRYGDPTKTFDRYDRFSVGVGGPTPLRNLTYFAAYEGSFSDPYPASLQTTPHRTVLDFIRLGNRQSNAIHTSLKLAYRPNARDKVTFETLANRTIVTPYEHQWSREGFVQVRMDTVTDADGVVTHVRRYGAWSTEPVDSTYVPMNLADHTVTDDNRFRQISAAWMRQISSVTVATTRLSNVQHVDHRGVARLAPWEYDTQAPNYWNGNQGPGTEDNPYFVTHGDFPRYERHDVSTWALKSDVTTARWRRHQVKAGVEARYNRLENLALVQPNEESGGLPGVSRSDYVNQQPEGAFYAQDRWDFEGLVLNAGLRYDVFTPGEQIATSELPSGRRYKQQVSPRLGVAYPISVRDVLSFHYGWTYQTPQRGYVFENRGLNANVNVRGNPDLEPETNIAYQAALQHLFSANLTGQFAVFFRDIFGLIGVRQERDPFGNLVNVYTNGDYASARGLEATLTKSFSHRFSADLNYTYSLATGVASDPTEALQFFNGGRAYLPIGERALNWDQRHTLSLQSTLRDPARWGLRMLWTYGSGFPFTPAFRDDRRPDPRLANSRRLPSAATLSLAYDRYFRVWGQSMTMYVDARNVLDATSIAELSPDAAAVFNPNVNLAGDDYRIYYSETGRAGGAYSRDRDGDGVQDWVPVHDPRVVEEGRRVRLGLALAF